VRVLSERQLSVVLGALAGTPRVVVGGNFATVNGRTHSGLGGQTGCIVSEQGAAVIWGHDAAGQAEQVIDHVAHPSVREQLREAGRSLGPGL
jgi:hypothetical protein